MLAKILHKNPGESKINYKTLLDSAPVGIYKTTIRGGILYANKTLVNMLGFRSLEEFIADGAIAKYKNPKDRKALIEILKKNGSARSFGTDLLTKAGKPINVLLNANLEGETLSGSIVDITERKRVETELLKFKLGLERSNDAVFITDIDGAINYVNPAFEKLYGFGREEALGKTPRIIKSGRLPESAYKQFWGTLLAKKVVSGELINKTKDGRLLTVEGSANPILDKSGNITGFLAIQSDITERKKMEEEMKKLNEDLKSKVEELERFNRLAVGRELKMIELKKKIREMEERK